MSLIEEFKEFALKGNVVDMAVGVVIGAGFGKIVSSLVADIITPPIGLLIGGVDFSNLKLIIKEGVSGVPAVTLNYGRFIQSVFDFIIMSAALFAVIKIINSLKRQEGEEKKITVTPTVDQSLLSEIRDILKSSQ